MNEKRKSEILLHIILVIFLMCMCLYHLDKLGFVAVLNDEFGYWGNASSLAGYDWKDLMQETPYYAWGYSLFLVPLMLIFKNYDIVYKSAIVLNLIFLIVSFECAVYISKRLLNNRTLVSLLLSFVVIIYPGNLVYAEVAWSELLLCMLMWLSVALVVSLLQNFSIIKYAGFLCVLGYMYVVHQRSIGIIFVGIFTAVFILKKHKKPIWSWIIPLIVFAVWYGLNSVIKNIQMEMYWADSQFSSMNNVGLNASTFNTYLSSIFENFKELLVSISGKFFYLLVASGGILFVTIFCSIYDGIKNIRKQNYENFEAYFYVLGSLLAMWGVCSLAMMGSSTRKDLLVYSRYMENAIGPVLLITLSWLVSNHKLIKVALMCGAAVVFIQVGYICTIIENAEGQFNTICSPVIGSFYQSSQTGTWMMLQITVTIFVIVFGIVGILKIKNEIYRCIGIVGVFLCFFIPVTEEADSYMLNWRNELNKNITVVRNYIEDNYPNADIIYIKDFQRDGYSVNPKYLQFMIPEREITVTDISAMEKDNIKEGTVILAHPDTKEVGMDARVELKTSMLSVRYVDE